MTAQPASGRILIVDDDPEMRRVLADFLQGEGFRVDQAADSGEALRHARDGAESYATVVLDNRLPDESGLEILPRLRALAPDALVILITSFGDERTHEEAFARGAYDLLLKPFSLDELLEVLRRAREDGPADTPAGGDGHAAPRDAPPGGLPSSPLRAD